MKAFSQRPINKNDHNNLVTYSEWIGSAKTEVWDFLTKLSLSIAYK